MTMPQTARTRTGRPPEPDDGVYYPIAPDVLPPEGMLHFVPQSYMQSALEVWLDNPDTLVASQMFIYYEPGNPRVSVSPDVYIIPNVGNDIRNSYFLWLEPEVPTFAMEVTRRALTAETGGSNTICTKAGASWSIGNTTPTEFI